MNTRPTMPIKTAGELRTLVREGKFDAPTCGHAPGFVQTNLVILPEVDAADFAEFCRLNSRPCPVVAQTTPGNPHPQDVAADADLRTDVPRYCVFRDGELEADRPTEITDLWRDDLVAFLLGCSFTFENALQAAGVKIRHIEQGRNVSMYRTDRPCKPAGRFAGNLVVSMRPFPTNQIDEVVRITSCFPEMHGGPIHIGDPSGLGIADLGRPEFGDAVDIRDDEVPLFWACGVTPRLALAGARCELVITHSPGCMFVTDLKDDQFFKVHPAKA